MTDENFTREFLCSVCGSSFTLSKTVLAKYPNWTPRYCREHSPKKTGASTSSAGSVGNGTAVFQSNKTAGSRTRFEDLSPAEVLEKFSAGPDTGIFTDGGARPNPGPGGWGLVKVLKGNLVLEKSGGAKDTTNNRMELSAIIEALKLVDLDEELSIYTDSELCCNTLNKWAHAWRANGWKKKSGPIKNLELVQEAFALKLARPRIRLNWIEAHNGWRWNEYVDALATEAVKKWQSP